MLLQSQQLKCFKIHLGEVGIDEQLGNLTGARLLLSCTHHTNYHTGLDTDCRLAVMRLR